MRSLWALKPAARRFLERCIILAAPVGWPFQARVFLLPTDTLLFKSRDRLTITITTTKKTETDWRLQCHNEEDQEIKKDSALTDDGYRGNDLSVFAISILLLNPFLIRVYLHKSIEAELPKF